MTEYWDVRLGRQPMSEAAVRSGDATVADDDMRVWIEKEDEDAVCLTLYGKKLVTLLREDEDRAMWLASILTQQILGEIVYMRYVTSLQIVAKVPKNCSFMPLAELPRTLKDMGFDLSVGEEALLELYTGYQLESDDDPDAVWRADVIAGSSNCMPIIEDYLNDEVYYINTLHADGTVAGFLCYSLDDFTGEDRTQKIFDFREELLDYLEQKAGADAFTFTGGATGISFCYLDFIAWDLLSVLSAAKEFFENSNLSFAGFHVFRQGPDYVTLIDRNEDGGLEPMANLADDEEKEESFEDFEYIPYSPENDEAFYQQIEQWNDADEFSRCIMVLETIPEKQWDYRAAYALSRSLENYAIIGDHENEPTRERATKALNLAIDVLESVCEEGNDKAEWNMRMAYAYQYLLKKEEVAIAYAQRWAELDPRDKDAKAVIADCRYEIEKREKRAAKKKTQRAASNGTPFADFDFTEFWDDNDYALREYVSDPPYDELIAEIEAELGYKLPVSYIWLMKQHNGGMPVNTCYPTDTPTGWAEDHVAITGIFGIGKEKSCSLCGELGSQFMHDEWEYPAIGVAICDCPSAGYDMIFLDYRECGPQDEPKVVHIDQENDYAITPLADSFEEFIRGLVNEEEFDEYDD